MTEPISSSEAADRITPGESRAPTSSIGQAVRSTGSSVNNVHSYVDGHYFHLTSLAWSKDAVPGTVIYKAPVSPKVATGMVERLASLYNAWTGGAEFTVDVTSNAFQSGKLGLVWIPPNIDVSKTAMTVTDFGSFPHVIVDVRDHRVSLLCGDQNSSLYHLMSSSDIGGTFVVYVYNQLVSSGNTVGAVMCNIGCKYMFEFYQPLPPLGQTTSTVGTEVHFNINQPTIMGPFGAMCVLPADYKVCKHYLHGVMQADGNWYKGLNVYRASTNPKLSRMSAPINQGYNRLYPLQQAALVASQAFFQDAAKYYKVDQFKYVSNAMYWNGAEAGATNEVPFPPYDATWFQLVQSIAYDQEVHFTPKGRTPESFLCGLVNHVMSNSLPEIPSLNRFPLFGIFARTTLQPGQAFMGTLFDANTNQPILPFKLYYEGFMTTAATASTQLIETSYFTFRFTDVVDATQSIPVLTVAEAQYLLSNECSKRPKKILKQSRWRQSQEPWQELDLESSQM